MKIFCTNCRNVDSELADRLSADGYDEICKDLSRYGLREAVRMLTMCDALLVWGDDLTNQADGLFRDIAKACGIRIVDAKSYRMAEMIVATTEKYFALRKGGIKAKTRKWKVVQSRMIVAVLLDDRHVDCSRIAKLLGVNRATVYYYVRRAKELIIHNVAFKSAYYDILNKSF